MEQAIEAAAARRRHGFPRMTYEQFLRWDGDNQHVEWVNGEVVSMTPISDEHNVLGTFLIRLVGDFVEQFKLGQIRTDPFQMKTGPDLPGRAPDILFVTRRRAHLIRKTFLDGPADLVVEIISPDGRTIDRVTKFREYEQGGVREYWLLDPERRRAEFYRRGRDGRFRPIHVGDDGVFRSAVVKGLWLHVDWLWARPPLQQVRRQLGLS
jgi:Uma2 family endonuclease